MWQKLKARFRAELDEHGPLTAGGWPNYAALAVTLLALTQMLVVCVRFGWDPDCLERARIALGTFPEAGNPAA